jgi:hypothetical protein
MNDEYSISDNVYFPQSSQSHTKEGLRASGNFPPAALLHGLAHNRRGGEQGFRGESLRVDLFSVTEARATNIMAASHSPLTDEVSGAHLLDSAPAEPSCELTRMGLIQGDAAASGVMSSLVSFSITFSGSTWLHNAIPAERRPRRCRFQGPILLGPCNPSFS